MTKSKIADHLAGKLDISKKQANMFLDELATLAYKEASANGRVGLGNVIWALLNTPEFLYID